MTIPLEHVDSGTPIGRNFEVLRRLVLDTGGRSIQLRFGTATVTWGGVNNWAEVTVTHGLTKIVSEHATANSQAGTGSLAAMTNGHTATTLTIRVATLDGTVPLAATTTPVSWVAVG